MFCSHFQFQAAQTEWSITMKTLKKTAKNGKTYKVGYFEPAIHGNATVFRKSLSVFIHMTAKNELNN